MIILSKVFLSVCMVALTTLGVSVHTASAQMHQPGVSTSTTQKKAAQTLATVNIQNSTYTQQGNSFTISFDITNGVGIQTEVNYALELVAQGRTGQYIADEKVFTENLTLGEHTSLHKTIQYVAPSGLHGVYALVIASKNVSGFPLGISNLGNVTLSPATGVEILPESCLLNIQGEKGNARYTLHQGVDINSNETLVLSCTAQNFGGATTALPDFETHYRTVFGEVVPAQGGDVKPIVFSANEKKSISLILPKATSPQAYDLQLRLMVGDKASNTVVSHYVLRGPSATIQLLSLDKDYYKLGQTAKVMFVWTPSSDGFAQARGSVSPSATTYSATLVDGSGVACASALEEPLPLKARIELTLPVQRTCKDPHLSLALKDVAGVALAHRELTLQTTRFWGGSPWLMFLSLLLLAVGVVVVVTAYRTRSHKK